jgi:hypothetical protein
MRLWLLAVFFNNIRNLIADEFVIAFFTHFIDIPDYACQRRAMLQTDSRLLL